MQNAEKISITMTPEMMQVIRERVKASVDDPRPSVGASEVKKRLQALHADTVKGHGREGP